MSTTPNPVDSTTRTCCGAIGTHTPSCTATPPAWCLPGATPEHNIDHDGSTVTTWTRDVGEHVWIACDDQIRGGRLTRTPPRIVHYEAPRDGMDTTEALQLARELVAAANILTEATE